VLVASGALALLVKLGSLEAKQRGKEGADEFRHNKWKENLYV